MDAFCDGPSYHAFMEAELRISIKKYRRKTATSSSHPTVVQQRLPGPESCSPTKIWLRPNKNLATMSYINSKMSEQRLDEDKE